MSLHTRFNILNLPITLLEVIYLPKLDANSLSVGQMMNANVDVIFSRQHSSLLKDNDILAHSPKMGNLFTYTTLSMLSTTIIDLAYNEAHAPAML